MQICIREQVILPLRTLVSLICEVKRVNTFFKTDTFEAWQLL